MTGKQVGRAAPADQARKTWVQTERAAHEAWARMITKAPTAARLLHVLIANMDASSNALVASQAVIGELMGGVHRHTVRKAIQTLETERWIEVIQIGGKGGALAYVVNSRVAWARPRNERNHAVFSAQVLVSSSEQTASIEDRPPLRQIPMLVRGEMQSPSGDGEIPPSQPSMPGMEPDLPVIQEHPDPWAEERAELQHSDAAGIPRKLQLRDPDTIDWVDED